MIGRLMGRAKLVALATAIAALSAACASGATGDSTNTPQSSATNTPVATSAAGTAEPTNVAVLHDITGDLFLDVDSPASDDAFVTTNSVQVIGHTTIDALLSINDTVVDVDENGQFAFWVDLDEGPNLIEVVASNAAGDERNQELLVIYEPA